MNLGPRLALLLGLAALALATCPPASAGPSTLYDPPTLTVVESGYYNLVVRIKAGPSGTPAGFGLQWMRAADFYQLGGWPADPVHPALHYGRFTGTPTMHLESGAVSYCLEPGEAVVTEPGNFFDYTGLATDNTDPLVPGATYMLRVAALGDDRGLASEYSPAVYVKTLVAECTQGFWKNHPEVWPASALPMLLGTVSYNSTQLMSIFNTPARGNGLVSLAHQLIATKLNLGNGSDPSPIHGTIDAADALIGSLVVPSVGGGFLDPAITDPLTQALDDYNNGRVLGVSPCPVNTIQATWGDVKALYR